MEDIVVQVSASALSDHMNRLYQDGDGRDVFPHIDVENATITFVAFLYRAFDGGEWVGTIRVPISMLEGRLAS
jgi:hypothetical protein